MILSEITQNRERQRPSDFTYTWNLKSKINKRNRSRLINITNWLPDGREWFEGLGEKDKGI